MDWLDALIKKIPTLKGIAEFFYVATHWGVISHEREEYRRQIKDREEWSKAAEQTLKRNHEQEKQRITKEYEEKLKTQQDELVGAIVPLVESYANAVARLAIHYRLHPLNWELERELLDPPLRKSIEAMMPRLPPPPPLATLPSLFGPLAGRGQNK
jgi:hypothetical protein